MLERNMDDAFQQEPTESNNPAKIFLLLKDISTRDEIIKLIYPYRNLKKSLEEICINALNVKEEAVNYIMEHWIKPFHINTTITCFDEKTLDYFSIAMQVDSKRGAFSRGDSLGGSNSRSKSLNIDISPSAGDNPQVDMLSPRSTDALSTSLIDACSMPTGDIFLNSFLQPGEESLQKQVEANEKEITKNEEERVFVVFEMEMLENQRKILMEIRNTLTVDEFKECLINEGSALRGYFTELQLERIIASGAFWHQGKKYYVNEPELIINKVINYSSITLRKVDQATFLYFNKIFPRLQEQILANESEMTVWFEKAVEQHLHDDYQATNELITFIHNNISEKIAILNQNYERLTKENTDLAIIRNDIANFLTPLIGRKEISLSSLDESDQIIEQTLKSYLDKFPANERPEALKNINLNPNLITNEKGDTLLHIAVRTALQKGKGEEQKRYYDRVTNLLKIGANPFIKNNEGMTAFKLVLESRDVDKGVLLSTFMKEFKANFDYIWLKLDKRITANNDVISLWEKFMKELLNHVDDYTNKKLVETLQYSWIMRWFISPRSSRVEQTSECFSIIFNAGNALNIDHLVLEFVKLNAKATRGVLNRSQLFEKMSEIIVKLQAVIESSAMEKARRSYYEELVKRDAFLQAQDLNEKVSELEEQDKKNRKMNQELEAKLQNEIDKRDRKDAEMQARIKAQDEKIKEQDEKMNVLFALLTERKIKENPSEKSKEKLDPIISKSTTNHQEEAKPSSNINFAFFGQKNEDNKEDNKELSKALANEIGKIKIKNS